MTESRWMAALCSVGASNRGRRRWIWAPLVLIAAALFVATPARRAMAVPPSNDLIENATPITSLPFTATQDSTDATVSPTDPPPACNQG